MELYAFNPGPLDESVLYDQEKHVSSAVWEGQERGALRCHEHTSKLDQWSLAPMQIELIEKAGFRYLRCIPAISLDNPLISALVERWRRETNTFHLNVGEMTVTLEDVAYLLGLAIDGEPVIGVTYTSCDSVCEKFLGRAPDPGYTTGGMVKLSWLKECFSQCPETASFEDIKCHTRAYLLYLVGSTIFSTTTGNKVPVMYLPLFDDFEQCGKYAWGAAALAFLYRALGNASLRSQSTVSGSLTLLQCWSYYHLNIGRPKLTQDPLHDYFPLVLRWKGKQSGPTSNRDITFYRKVLDSLKPSDVEWHPYRDIDPMVIPEDIASTLFLGRSKTMLICFDKAERHLPDRVLRQYGMRQPIPPPVPQWERKSRGVDGGVDLSGKMESELKEWSERHLHIIQSGETLDDSDYMHWFLKITRRFVGRPIPLASEFQRMNATLREVAHIADTMSLQGLDNEQIQSVTRIRYIAHECLRDQAGSVVTLASAAPENENGKRGRGKEKVRRKGVVKRRRKDDMEPYQVVEQEGQLVPNPAAAQVDYVHIAHPIDMVCQPQVAVDGSVSARLYHTADVMAKEIDDSHLCVSVNEVDAAQMCLAGNGVDANTPCSDNEVHGSRTASVVAGYTPCSGNEVHGSRTTSLVDADTPCSGNEVHVSHSGNEVHGSQTTSVVDANTPCSGNEFHGSQTIVVDDDGSSQTSDQFDRVDEPPPSGEVDSVDDSKPLHVASENDDPPSEVDMVTVPQSTHQNSVAT